MTPAGHDGDARATRPAMTPLPLRLPPDADLRAALDEALATRAQRAAFVIAGIGSLRRARLRSAGAHEPVVLDGPLEILTLSGTVSGDGCHLHMSVAGADGRVQGGHVASGCLVRTTAEVLLMLLPEWAFTREHDPATGFAELVANRMR